MRTTWKYPLRITDEQLIHVPKSAESLSVQLQGGEIQLWMLVDPEPGEKIEETTRRIFIFGTGHPIPDHEDIRYIATVQCGPMVWHVFEETRN